MRSFVNKLVQVSVNNSPIVVLIWLIIAALGVMSLRTIHVDAIPDTASTQVIVRTPFPGQSPLIVEQQVTFPITRKLLSIPEATAVRGFSHMGDSYVFAVFNDEITTQNARARVLEYIGQLRSQLPSGVEPAIGPDASAVGWIYEYALSSGDKTLAELRSIQDWYLTPELQAISGVAEVAVVGGMVKQYQIVLDPEKQRQRGLTLSSIITALKQANSATGGSVMEQGEAEYAIQFTGYLNSLNDIRDIAVGLDASTGTPVYLRDIATVRLGPQQRRGVAELDGNGEVVGGIIVMQTGADPV